MKFFGMDIIGGITKQRKLYALTMKKRVEHVGCQGCDHDDFGGMI